MKPKRGFTFKEISTRLSTKIVGNSQKENMENIQKEIQDLYEQLEDVLYRNGATAYISLLPLSHLLERCLRDIYLNSSQESADTLFDMCLEHMKDYKN